MRHFLSFLLTIFLIVLILFVVTQITEAQTTNTFPSSGATGIGTTTPNASSLFEVKSTTKGILIPRMTKNQRDAIVTPATGLLVYQTNSTPGFYYWNGTAWTAVASSGANTSLSNLTATSVNQPLLPNASGTLNLGSNSFKWKDAYITNIKFADGTTQSTAGGGGAETDPQVGTNSTNYIPKWNGSALTTGIIQDDGSKIKIAGTTIYDYAKFTIDQSSHTNTLNLINQNTGSQIGIYNVLYNTGLTSKTCLSNEATASATATGNVYGVYNGLTNAGSGISYGNYNVINNSGTGGIYGNYSTLSTSNSNSIVYGSYQTISSSGGNTYGNYTTISGNGTLWGQYINLPTGTGGNKYGVYVNAPATSGINYGIYSTVSTSNSSAYAGYFNGQVLCSDKVGIGTSSALSVKLQVDGGADAEPGSGGFLVLGNTNSSNIAIDNNEIMARNNGATSTLYLQNDGGDLNLCYAGGNVMIGASVPAAGYLLSVDGKIMCEELKVQLSENWPDYVFDDNYNLHSISELKSFIKQNKHLPGIPSADEMKDRGISVGEMQTKMMQKIEELSLYIIELQNQIDDLKSQKN